MSLQAVAIELADLLIGLGPERLDFARFPHRVPEHYDRATKSIQVGVTQLDTTVTDPFFLDAAGAPISKPAPSLQSRLTDLVNGTVEKDNVVNKAKDSIAIALVMLDPTGADATQVEFAGYRVDTPFYAASAAKIAVVYALFQLRAELNILFDETRSIRDLPTLTQAAAAYWQANGRRSGHPKIDRLFRFDINGTKVVDFTTDVENVLTIFSHTESGVTRLMQNIGFDYIASLVLQSGLFDVKRSGVWLRQDYARNAWNASPLKRPNVHNITALSAARFFTLLAQGRLVSQDDSADIQGVLGASGGCVAGDHAHPQDPNILASKCGILGPMKPGDDDRVHDAYLYDDGVKRYVLVLLTLNVGSTYFDIRERVVGLFTP